MLMTLGVHTQFYANAHEWTQLKGSQFLVLFLAQHRFVGDLLTMVDYQYSR